jgi:hypothetical protein
MAEKSPRHRDICWKYIVVCLRAQRYCDAPELGEITAPSFEANHQEDWASTAVKCLRRSNELELRLHGVFVSLAAAIPVIAETIQYFGFCNLMRQFKNRACVETVGEVTSSRVVYALCSRPSAQPLHLILPHRFLLRIMR